MNVHAPDKNVRDFFQCLDWKGKRFIKNGKTYIRAKHVIFNVIMYYCFEDDFAWFPDCNKMV